MLATHPFKSRIKFFLYAGLILDFSRNKNEGIIRIVIISSACDTQ